MREIKFRAWDNQKNRWYSEWENPNRSEWTPDDGHRELSITSSDGAITIEQFTGLRDKNGKEIYEGDIVNKQYHNLECHNGIGVVSMGTGNDSDGYQHGSWYGWMAGNSSLLDLVEECEVIGNIHENPELLHGN